VGDHTRMVPLLSIIIVNYNAGPYLSKCLASIERQSFNDYEVIIVDNASSDNSLHEVEGKASVRIIRNEGNLGYAAGQNQGINHAQGEFLLSLNFDIILLPDFLRYLIRAMHTYPEVGTATGKILRMQPDGQLMNKFDNAGLLLPRQRVPVHRGEGEQDLGQYDNKTLVFGAVGAAALYRRQMINELAIGEGRYFDEDFFTWYEDIDLDWRGRLSGWECLYVPDAVAYHVGDPHNHSTTDFAVRHGIRNRWQMIIANECFHCFIRNCKWLMLEEVSLLRFVLFHGRFRAYLRALGELFLRMPSTLKKRNHVRSNAKVSCLPVYPIALEKITSS